MNDTLYFPPEDFPAIQVELLMQILGYQKAMAIVATSTDKTFTKEMVAELASRKRDEVLLELYTNFGKTPDV